MSAEVEQASRTACLLLWPEAEAMRHDPRCCRFPKPCSIPDAEQSTVRVLTGGSGLTYDPNPPCVVDHQSIPPGRSCPNCGERSPWRDTGGPGVGAETIESLRAELDAAHKARAGWHQLACDRAVDQGTAENALRVARRRIADLELELRGLYAQHERCHR